jgi:hypothetical protein
MNSIYSSQKAKGKPGKNIFISYREKDSAGEAGRLVDSLKEHFVNDQIFMDIDKIEPGVDFTDAISNSLESCDVMLAIIGPRWMGDTKQMSRIKNDGDWVRLEIATALARNIRVVPVLVDGADLPTSEEDDTLKAEPSTPVENNRQANPGEQVELNENTGDQTATEQGNAASNAGTNITNVVAYKNVNGTWSDVNGMYYLVISQQSEYLNVNAFGMNGVQSGQGSGTVYGNNVKMDINIYNVGVISLSGTMANDNINLKGTSTIAVDGVPYTEALHLVKN